MSVDQLPPGKARPAQRDAQFVRYDEYIDKQIDSTRRSVKAVDLLTAVLTITVGTLGFLLAAAMIEHWLVPGGFNVAVRLLLFVVLVGSLTVFTTRRLWPLVRGSINPAYAAQAIEQENPSLKNSLLNLLLFRQHRDDVTDAVYETLEAEAAKRLTRVPIDSAVDRTQLLRLGYALVLILAVAALYKILSPKDPFASAERVLMPWARLAAPSRVSIENIEPGHVTLSRGETLSVAADVRGIGEDDPVVVRFTTADGQAVDRAATMKPDTAGLRFTGQIPPQGDAALGVAQDLRYHIEAGDARSLEYKVTVISAPTITVEQIDYDYPDYTGYADRSIERLGDIRAIEGTRVTIHARANQPIDEAAVDFESDGRRDVQFTARGEQAQASFTLELRDDRLTAKYTSYSLRFTGVDGRSNRDPVKFPIEVVPDVQPEAAILAPKEKTRDVRLDETVEIYVEARDPDFALAEVRVWGEAAGRNVIDERLLRGEHNGRFTGRLQFTPGKHELHAGDVVRYWVTARDNRAPQANETATDSQTFRIVGPDPQRPPQDRLAQRDQPGQRDQRDQPQDDPQQQGVEQQNQEHNEGQGGQTGGQSSDSSEGGEQGDDQQSGKSSSSEGDSGESGGEGSANQSSENGSGENSQNQQRGEQQPGGESSGGSESSASEQGGESGLAQQRPGGQQQSGEGGRPGEQANSPQGSQAESQRSQGNRQGEDHNAQHGAGDDLARGARDAEDSSPVSSAGDNDGEAFERIQEFLKKEGQLPQESAEQNAGKQTSGKKDAEKQAGESASGDSESGQQESAAQQSGEQQSGERQSARGRKQGDETQSNDAATQEAKSPDGDSRSQTQSEQPGADTRSSENQSKTDEPSSDGKQQQPDGGQQTNSQGESGTGNQPEQGQGAPESQDLKPTEKWQQHPSSDEQGKQQEAPSGGHGKQESDSQGDQGGDHAGGGEEGGGQKSNRDGTGSSGQNQSADEGAGESSEQGAGRNSSSGGQDAQANERTGESSRSMQGAGSQQRNGDGNKAGGERGNQQGQSQGGEQGEKQEGSAGAAGQQQGEQGREGEQGQQQKKPSQSGGEQGANHSQHGGEDAAARDVQNQQPNEAQGAQRSGSNAADGAGRVPNAPIQPSSSTGEAPGADAANLEYARRQTDLVLETLAEQMKRQKVDKRLLDKLGWTEADMKRFVERWQQLKAAADANVPDANEAQRELDDALRSLGLRRGELQQSRVIDDQNRNLRQGYRGPVPLEYRERLRAYNQGVSRARPADE